jgi:hypothetical protein
VLDQATQAGIVRATQAYWDAESGDPELVARMARKKEKGQGLSNWVEEKTVDMLEETFRDRVCFQLGGPTGKARRDRSMGDLWFVGADGNRNPINVKTGVKTPGTRSSGQPNLVALPKIADALLEHWIDSYYLLFVHFMDESPPTARVSMYDLFSIVEDYVSYNAGPQQMMLKAREFDPPPAPTYGRVDPKDALQYLLDLRDRSNAKLFAKRAKDLETMRRAVDSFDQTADIDQGGLNFDPPS